VGGQLAKTLEALTVSMKKIVEKNFLLGRIRKGGGKKFREKGEEKNQEHEEIQTENGGQGRAIHSNKLTTRAQNQVTMTN